ncbi:MAG: hypothetical protein ABUR63_05060 [Verrucomicrobiota bacterium]
MRGLFMLLPGADGAVVGKAYTPARRSAAFAACPRHAEAFFSGYEPFFAVGATYLRGIAAPGQGASGITSVTTAYAGIVTVKLQSLMAIGASVARFSVREVRSAVTWVPTFASGVRSNVKLFVADVSPTSAHAHEGVGGMN